MPSDLVPRAPRYAVEMTVRYRPAESTSWLRGTTRNVSHTGVLFLADRALAPDTPLEMTLLMPVEIVGQEGVRVTCHGRIVRVVPPSGPEPRPGLAATIAHYRFVRGTE